LSALVNVSVACAPDTPSAMSNTKNGTPLMPSWRASSSSRRTSSAYASPSKTSTTLLEAEMNHAVDVERVADWPAGVEAEPLRPRESRGARVGRAGLRFRHAVFPAEHAQDRLPLVFRVIGV